MIVPLPALVPVVRLAPARGALGVGRLVGHAAFVDGFIGSVHGYTSNAACSEEHSSGGSSPFRENQDAASLSLISA